MSSPLPAMPADELWALVTQCPLPSRLVDHPRRYPTGHARAGEPICQIRMRVLTQEEMTLAKAEAAASTMKLLKRSAANADAAAKTIVDAMSVGRELTDSQSRAYSDIVQLEQSIELLYRACRLPDDIDRPFFPAPVKIRAHHTIDEIGAMVTAWLILMSEASPIGDWDSADEMEAWLVQLAKGGSAHPLALRSHLAVSHACLYLARRLYGSPSDSSSPTWQPDSTPNSSDNEKADSETSAIG